MSNTLLLCLLALVNLFIFGGSVLAYVAQRQIAGLRRDLNEIKGAK